MSPPVERSALYAFLQTTAPMFHGKLLELRETVQRWLAYIPNTFPHYTRHTVEHSDELVRQASKLLFVDEDPARPVVGLSATEAYLLSASAYLHDAGMVTSDSEKAEILTSAAWTEWVTNGGGTRRWQEIQQFREGPAPRDEVERQFLADVQVRFLLAEFVRRQHHLRAGDVIREHQSALARFAFDDPIVSRTIAHICISHGLRPHELDDADRFPERRDIMGEPVNVKFLAIILRLADLLDMSTDRACPLLLNAALSFAVRKFCALDPISSDYSSPHSSR